MQLRNDRVAVPSPVPRIIRSRTVPPPHDALIRIIKRKDVISDFRITKYGRVPDHIDAAWHYDHQIARRIEREQRAVPGVNMRNVNSLAAAGFCSADF
jgi:hypothetical protein